MLDFFWRRSNSWWQGSLQVLRFQWCEMGSVSISFLCAASHHPATKLNLFPLSLQQWLFHHPLLSHIVMSLDLLSALCTCRTQGLPLCHIHHEFSTPHPVPTQLCWRLLVHGLLTECPGTVDPSKCLSLFKDLF